MILISRLPTIAACLLVGGLIMITPRVARECYAAGVLSVLGVNDDVETIVQNLKRSIDQLVGNDLDHLDASVASGLARAQFTIDQLLDHADAIRGKTFNDLSDAQKLAFQQINNIVEEANNGTKRMERIEKDTSQTLMRILPWADRRPYVFAHTQFVIVGGNLPSDVLITLDGGQLAAGGQLELAGKKYDAPGTSDAVQFIVPRADFAQSGLTTVGLRRAIVHLKSESFDIWRLFRRDTSTIGLIIYTLPSKLGEYTLTGREPWVDRNYHVIPSDHAHARSVYINSAPDTACYYVTGNQTIVSAEKKVDLDHEACFGGAGNSIGFDRNSWDARHACIWVQAIPPGNCSAAVEAHIEVGVEEPVTKYNHIAEHNGSLFWGQDVPFDDIPLDFTLTIPFANGERRTFTGSDYSPHPWLRVEYTRTTKHLTLRPTRIEEFN